MKANSHGTWSIATAYASEERGTITVIDKSTIPDAEALGLGTGKAVEIKRTSNIGNNQSHLDSTYTFTQPLSAADLPNGAVFKARVYMPYGETRLTLLAYDGSNSMVNVFYRGKTTMGR